MRNWTTVGEKESVDRAQVESAIPSLEWIPFCNGMSLPAMPGMGIQEAIKQLRIPKVSHIAISNHLAPFGFYGIRGHYTNGDADVFILDSGTHLTPICTDFTETFRPPEQPKIRTRQVKCALKRDESIPVGIAAPLHLDCICGARVDMPHVKGLPIDAYVCGACGREYDPQGWLKKDVEV